MDVVYSNNTVKPVVDTGFEMGAVKTVAGCGGDMTVNIAANGGMFGGKMQTSGDEGSGSISFHNITYTVEQRTCLKKGPPKVILNDVRYSYFNCRHCQESVLLLR